MTAIKCECFLLVIAIIANMILCRIEFGKLCTHNHLYKTVIDTNAFQHHRRKFTDMIVHVVDRQD